MSNRILTLILTFVPILVSAQSHYEAYIQRYADIAVAEMYRSGVPASITLAQGLLESGIGRSELAVKGNNHFGIKCHNGWNGGKVYHDDDAKGECFRKYDTPEESYRDHSDFLRYRDRYKFLFDYEITDYKAWAYGLKKAGYATDPAYPKKLIGLIEEYDLHVYDTQSQTVSTIPLPPTQIEQSQTVRINPKQQFRFSLSREMYSQNGVPFIYAVEGETYRSIAASRNLFLREILKFNDVSEDAPLNAGTIVYLQRKKKQSAKGLDKHVMEEGETLWDIAQRYAVRLDSICSMNELDEDDVVCVGDIIRLRK